MNFAEKMKLPAVLELHEITKIFPGVKALNQVSLELRPGEVLALVGENGAGKSTLINCITGVFQPEEGSIAVDGVAVKLKSPQHAFDKGITVVHQERNLIPTFDVAENIFFSRACTGMLSFVDSKKMHEEAVELLKRVNLNLDPYSPITDLSSAQKQMIEIARALSIDSHILLLDEPTASISIAEADKLLETVDALRKQGVAVIYVSHKLDEIFTIADRVKIIRDGQDTGPAIPIGELDRDTLIERMVGQRAIHHAFPSHDRKDCLVVLEAKRISSRNNPNKNSFALRKGEILGWYGLVGAGRTELIREVIGIDPITSGSLEINGKPTKVRSYADAMKKYKISYLSENRKEEGLFISHSIERNIVITALNQMKNGLKLHSYKKERQTALENGKTLQIKMSSPANLVSSLSGGNQQKVSIGKCLITQPEIIIFDEPTVGIDIKTKAEIHQLIYNLSQEGKSVILITSDLSEMIQIAERIQVFREGSIVGELMNPKDYDEGSSQIMSMMLGK